MNPVPDITGFCPDDPLIADAPLQLALLKQAEKLGGLGHWQVNTVTGDLYWSEQIYLMHGVHHNHFTPTVEKAIAFYHPDDRQMVANLVERAIATCEGFEFSLRIIRADGQLRYVRSIGTVDDNTRGEPVLFGVFQDITQSEELLIKLRESNAALDRFACLSSHDLQEPVRIVHQFSQLLAPLLDTAQFATAKEKENAAAYLGFISDSAERAQRMVIDLLAYSRLRTEEEPPRPVNLSSILSQILMIYGHAVEEVGGVFTMDDLPTLSGHETRFYQLFANLLQNAVKYRHPTRPLRVHIGYRHDGYWHHFSVTDNGCGVSAKDRDRLFELFYRGKQPREGEMGSGIGLAMVQEIIRQYGGQIHCEENLDGGSRFVFTLPA